MSPADRYARTAACRAGQFEWFADMVDPDRELPPGELEAQVRELRRERMRQLAYLSHEKRRQHAARPAAA